MVKGTKAQSAAEYIVLIGIISIAVFFIGPLFKRGLQSMVKVSADQIGNQHGSEQNIVLRRANEPPEDPQQAVADGGGFMVSSSTQTVSRLNKNTVTPGQDGVMDIIVNESMETSSDSLTDMGYTPPE